MLVKLCRFFAAISIVLGLILVVADVSEVFGPYNERYLQTGIRSIFTGSAVLIVAIVVGRTRGGFQSYEEMQASRRKWRIFFTLAVPMLTIAIFGIIEYSMAAKGYFLSAAIMFIISTVISLGIGRFIYKRY
jgi:membrane protease YdiL (CAAX protease family)